MHTCTACAGTLILEFAALSRFSGNPVYENRAADALSFLWQQRNRYSDLVGTEINVKSGEWIRRGEHIILRYGLYFFVYSEKIYVTNYFFSIAYAIEYTLF